jgi:hypothetical protein
MSLQDVLRGDMPETKDELKAHVLNNPDVQKMIEHAKKSPTDYNTVKQHIDDVVDRNYETFRDYIGPGKADTLSKAGSAVGYAADTYALTGDIFGALGGKFVHLMAQIPDAAYGVWYGVKTGDYLGAGANLLRKAGSYVPGLTFLDKGLRRIAKERMAEKTLEDLFENDEVKNIAEDADSYKEWTRRASEDLEDKYAGVKDRAKNVFRPDYEPETA